MSTEIAVRDDHALAPLPQGGMVRPVGSIDEIVQAWEAFQDVKARLITSDDLQHLGEGRIFPKKSAWRKIAAAFGVSDDIVHEEQVTYEDGSFLWRFWVRAIAPNGRSAIGVGVEGVGLGDDANGEAVENRLRFTADAALSPLHRPSP